MAQTITKKNLAQAVAESTGITQHLAHAMVDSLFTAMRETLIAGNRIEVRGFGVLETRATKPKPAARNPRTGEVVYVHDVMKFPFQAKCIEARRVSPLKEGEIVQVLSILPMEDPPREIFAEIEWEGRKMGVPLSQLEGVDVDEETEEAIEDWRYWTQRGYGF